MTKANPIHLRTDDPTGRGRIVEGWKKAGRVYIVYIKSKSARGRVAAEDINLLSGTKSCAHEHSLKAQDVLRSTPGAEMKPSYVQRLLLTADPFSAIRKTFGGWKKSLHAKDAKPRSRARHLTCKQREDIADGLQDSAVGPVSMTAVESDKEAVNYEAEIANVLEETGFEIEIDNATVKKPDREIAPGVEMIVKDQTIRPAHAFQIVQAFRRAGITITTSINALRGKNDTLYITVGSKDASPAIVPMTARTAGRSKSLALLLVKWKKKFFKLA